MKTVVTESKPIHRPDPLPANAARSRAFDLCVRKTHRNIQALADHPKTWSNAPDGNYAAYDEGFYDIGNWTSSFFTGMALIAWRQTEDEYFLNQVLRLAPLYREKVFTRHLDTHHDLGFLYSLYSVALYKLTGNPEHREVGLRAAEILAQRFNKKGGFIRAWGHMNTTEQDNMAIIDCLMNLPLLYWAAEASGDRKFYEIAVAHADTTLKNFVRADGSVCHAFRYDLKTGQPLGPDNICGHGVETHWARGTTWAIYGFALSFRHTGDQKYLAASLRLMRKFMASLDAEIVPLWDFRLPPNERPLRDASAASVAICAIQELEKLKAADESMTNLKHQLLERLTSEEYLDFNETCPGVQKLGQAGTSRNAYTSWGDYYLMEALDRELHGGETWW